MMPPCVDRGLQSVWPGTQVTIGPVIENGFCYDFFRDQPFTPEDFPAWARAWAVATHCVATPSFGSKALLGATCPERSPAPAPAPISPATPSN